MRGVERFLSNLLLLATQKSSNWSTTLDLLGRFFSVIIAIAFVMLLAYYATRWLAGARSLRHRKQNLRLIEGIAIGHQSSIQLVKAGEKVLLIGVSRERITFLAEIPREQILEQELNLPIYPFEKYFKAYRDKISGRTDEIRDKEDT